MGKLDNIFVLTAVCESLSGKVIIVDLLCNPVRMRIRKPKNITITQLAVVTATGIIGGVYIYKPLFEKFWFGEKRTAAVADTTTIAVADQVEEEVMIVLAV